MFAFNDLATEELSNAITYQLLQVRDMNLFSNMILNTF